MGSHDWNLDHVTQMEGHMTFCFDHVTYLQSCDSDLNSHNQTTRFGFAVKVHKTLILSHNSYLIYADREKRWCFVLDQNESGLLTRQI